MDELEIREKKTNNTLWVLFVMIIAFVLVFSGADQILKHFFTHGNEQLVYTGMTDLCKKSANESTCNRLSIYKYNSTHSLCVYEECWNDSFNLRIAE